MTQYKRQSSQRRYKQAAADAKKHEPFVGIRPVPIVKSRRDETHKNQQTIWLPGEDSNLTKSYSSGIRGDMIENKEEGQRGNVNLSLVLGFEWKQIWPASRVMRARAISRTR
jgi:hypothetical protein